jgi:hypothetical protein
LSYSDPLSVTINAVATPLARTGSALGSGTFSNADGTVKALVSHAYGKRTRRTFRLDFSKVSADALLPNTNVRNTMSAYIVVDVPVNGYSTAEALTNTKALVDALTASTYANLSKLLGGEN